MGQFNRKIVRRRVHCGDCTLAELCLPFSLAHDEVDLLDKLVKRSRPIERGEFLFRQGEAFQTVFAIRSGSVKSFCITDSGLEQITGFQFPSEILGMAGMDEGFYPMSAQALESTSVCEIPFEQLEELAEKIPQLRRQLMRTMSREIRVDQQMMLLLSKKASEERIATFLLNFSARLSARGYSANVLRLSMSRSEIGDYLGVAMETVSRAFARLQQRGLITVHGKELEIVDYTRLCQLAGGAGDGST